jgi:hypothetical protein
MYNMGSKRVTFFAASPQHWAVGAYLHAVGSATLFTVVRRLQSAFYFLTIPPQYFLLLLVWKFIPLASSNK